MAPLIHTRRQFLTLLGQASALGAAAPLGLNLLAARSAAALADPSDYKALVCIFLYGGNDAYNTFVPYDRASHGRYSSARSSIAVPRQGLAAHVLNPSNPVEHGRQIATNPVASDLTDLFNTGKLAVVANVGTLRRPITLDDYRNGRGVPPKLMSHNDQFSIWQTMDIEGAQSGWGGRMADLVVAANGESPMLTSISVGTSAVFAGGTSVDELAFGNQGPATLDSVQGNGSFHLDIASRLAAISDEGPHAAELGRRYNNAVEGGQQATEVLEGINRLVPRPPGDEVPPIYDQLDTVARTIVGHQRRNLRRQVFFVSMGGYDTHTASNEVHPGLLTNLSAAIRSFTAAMEQAGLSDQVTAFTASDFGRALTTNGQGTDHGWGGHHVVVGGAVKAQTIAGELPTVRLGGPDDIGQGRLLPSVAVDQYGATLARWFGVPDRELPIVFPGIAAFPTNDLGFMTPTTPPPGSTTTTAATSTTVATTIPSTTSPSTTTPSTTSPSTTNPPTTTPPTTEPPLLSGTVALRSVSTRSFLWVRASDGTVRADGSSANRSAAQFTVVPGDGATISLKATAGGRKNLLAVPNDADQTLKAKGGDGKRPRLLAKRGRNGSYRFESATFPGRYLRADGSTIDSGGTASSGDETIFDVVRLT